MSEATKEFSDILGDVFDIRDVIARFEHLDAIKKRDKDEKAEWKAIADFLADVEGSGGMEQWRGDWYPVTFCRDSYFEEFAREEADSLGLIDDDKVQWPYTCIDWAEAARQLQQDYSSTEIDGTTYWYRA